MDARQQLKQMLDGQLESIGSRYGEKAKNYFSVEMEETYFFLDADPTNFPNGEPTIDEIKDAVEKDLSWMEHQIADKNRPTNAAERKEHQMLLEIYGEYYRMLEEWKKNG